MANRRLLVTGSSGLIGSQVVKFFSTKGFEVHGIDNNQREVFFGPSGSTRWQEKELKIAFKHFKHYEFDIRDREGIMGLVNTLRPEAVIHAAAQPSHDKAASIPFDDFETNAIGTLNLIEACRQFCRESPFIFLSTNKVYGDAPNRLPIVELDTRWDYADLKWKNGINEEFTIDQSKHSLFGASKLAADILVQEYGRYFNIPTCILRGGCLTGPAHSGVEMHGFLSYLVRCNVTNTPYTIYGYKGKQVRDNIHAVDVATFIEAFINKPKIAAVYNIGGGRANTISILEAFKLAESMSGKSMIFSYKDQPREGDHVVYYTDLTKITNDYPEWSISVDVQSTIQEIYKGWSERLI